MNALAGQLGALHAAIVAADAPDARALLGESAPRLAVYREAYAARLKAALTDNFPVLRRAMGDAAFDALARAYLAAHPSRRPSIRWFGDALAGFMAARADLVAHPGLTELARMDWALREAFDAADAAPLTAAALRAVPAQAWPALRFALHPSVRIERLAWAVEAAWRALDAADPERGDAEPELPEPEPLDHALLVWRQGLETRWRSLADDESALLAALGAGASCAELAERAQTLAGPQAAPALLAGALARWSEDGLLVAPP